MLIFYRLLINIVFILSPFILIIRILKKKEDLKRFREKYCLFTKKREGKLIWFHGASVGEIQSIVPLLEKLDNDNEIKQILITSNTLSSSKIISNFKFKKVIHQFFPIDTNYFSNKFLDYWKPAAAIFIDSEIWPNMIFNLNQKEIPLTLLNARITKKTFKKWKILKNFSLKIFQKINLCLPANNESKKYLKELGANKIKLIGNLKYSQSENDKIEIDKSLKKFILSKKSWCASSTHSSEELFCGIVHKELKKKYKNILTIIIPRHINRIDLIKSELDSLELRTHIHKPKKKIPKDTDIYLINSYGQTKSFYSICKNVFLGGSLIDHGGQNPLEATRYGCNILHGPNISNFREIYKHLNTMNISKQITNEKTMIKQLSKVLSKKISSKKIQKKLVNIGNKILNSTYKEIKFIIKGNEV
jgi:3-deoxy-D-manno-octulosonic-acid transferase